MQKLANLNFSNFFWKDRAEKKQVNFRIGVALLRSLAMPEQDPESLQIFANSVLQMWELQGPEIEARRDGVGNLCADTAVLVFVDEPDGRIKE